MSSLMKSGITFTTRSSRALATEMNSRSRFCGEGMDSLAMLSTMPENHRSLMM